MCSFEKAHPKLRSLRLTLDFFKFRNYRQISTSEFRTVSLPILSEEVLFAESDVVGDSSFPPEMACWMTFELWWSTRRML